MANVDPNWQRVGTAIRRRFDELSLTFAEVGAAGGPTDKTLRAYMAGQPIVRADKRRELCRLLGWKVESIDAVLGGGNPVLVAGADAARQPPPYADSTDYNSRLARMPDHVLQAVNDIIDAEERRRGLA